MRFQPSSGPMKMRWRRGFFRLWLLLSVIWLAIISAIFYGSFASPYLSGQFFSFDETGKLAAFDEFSHQGLAAELAATNRAMQKVTFAEAPGVTFFAKSEIFSGADKSTFDFVTDPSVLLLANAAEAIQPKTSATPNFKGPIVALPVAQVSAIPELKAFANGLRNAATEAARTSLIAQAAEVGLVPPLIVFLIGWGLAWALSGFRRASAP